MQNKQNGAIFLVAPFCFTVLLKNSEKIEKYEKILEKLDRNFKLC